MSFSATAYQRLTSRVVSLPIDDIDTDQIIPAAFLKTVGRDGLGRGLFSDWRREPGFALNRPTAAGASILLTGHNFGCGSSREHAVWALLDWGFEAVLSAGFSDIFRSNAAKNGLLAAEIDPPLADDLHDLVERRPQIEITLDLERTEIRLPRERIESFRVEPFARHCLLAGVDQLGYLHQQLDAIRRFERDHRSWVDTSAVLTRSTER